MKTGTVTANATALLCLALMTGSGCTSLAENRPADQPASSTSPTQPKIVEGEGWNGFRLGATREELIQALGQPDRDSEGRWLKWKKSRFVDCLVDESRGAVELRFDEGFPGVTTAGLGIGSSVEAARAAYGKPSEELIRDTARKLIWESRGVLIWFNRDKATQIVVFRKS